MTQPSQPALPAVFNPGANPTGLANTQAPLPAPQKIGANTFVTNFGDESVRQYEFELFTGRTGVTDRIYLLRPFNIIRTRYHYSDRQNLKYVSCNSEYEVRGNQEILIREGECCRRLGKNNLRFGALVLRYITDKAGVILKPFVMPEVRLWKFGVDKFTDLRSINTDFPLQNFDLAVTCTDEKYQKLTISAKRESIYLMPDFPAELKQQFESWAEASLPKVPRELGRQISDADLLKELGAASAAPATMQAGDQPIQSFSDVIGGLK